MSSNAVSCIQLDLFLGPLLFPTNQSVQLATKATKPWPVTGHPSVVAAIITLEQVKSVSNHLPRQCALDLASTSSLTCAKLAC